MLMIQFILVFSNLLIKILSLMMFDSCRVQTLLIFAINNEKLDKGGLDSAGRKLYPLEHLLDLPYMGCLVCLVPLGHRGDSPLPRSGIFCSVSSLL